ncbi:MAG: tetratricopeptide repeat protein [Pseudomonadota bacterium]
MRLFSLLQVLLILSAFFCVAFAVYSPGFSAPMVYDSQTWIEGKAHIFAGGGPFEVMSIVPARPLFMVTLYLSYLWHGMDPYWFRVFNVMILAVAGVALTLLTGFVLQIPGARTTGTPLQQQQSVSILAGLLFVLHPLQSFTVLYIWQREAILACAFYFGGLAAYVGVRSGRLQRTNLGYVLTGTLFLAGMLSKEVLVTFPLVLALAEPTLFGRSFRQTVGRLPVILAITLPPFAAYFLISSSLYGPNSEHAQGIAGRLLGYYTLAGISPIHVVMTQCRVLFIYLSTVLLPPFSGTPFMTAVTVSASLADPPSTLLAVGGAAALVVVGAALVRRKAPYAFGIFFVLITLLPESFLIPHYMFFGYRPVLPMAGVLLITAGALLHLFVWAKMPLPYRAIKSTAVAACLAAVVLLGTMSYSQALRWNPLNFWWTAFRSLPEFSDKVQKIPYVDVIANLSGVLAAEGKYARAIQVLKKPFSDRENTTESSSTSRSRPGKDMTDREIAEALTETFRVDHRRTAVALVNLGIAVLGLGRYSDAVFIQREAVRIDPGSWLARFNLALALGKTGNNTAALQYYREAAALNPRSAQTFNNLGRALQASGSPEEALKAYAEALRLAPSVPEINYNLANTLLQLDRVDDAIDYYRKTVSLSPAHVEAHANMGAALLRSGRSLEAIGSLNTALKYENRNPHLFNLLGVAYAEQGKHGEAMKLFRKAISLDPAYEEAGRNLQSLERRFPDLLNSDDAYPRR